MLSLFSRFFRPPPTVKVVVTQRDPLRITVEEFRKDFELTKSAALALREPAVRQMLDCLWCSHLGRTMPPTDPPDALVARAQLAAGYAAALHDFEALGIRIKETPELEETFSNPDKPETNE